MLFNGDYSMGASSRMLGQSQELSGSHKMETAARKSKEKSIKEFGDFQTPWSLALAATRLLHRIGIRPCSIVEPTCGRGTFAVAAAVTFSEANKVIGVDINREHLKSAEANANEAKCQIRLEEGDFFNFDWQDVVKKELGPWLVVGNPPWVTSAELGAINSANLPEKSNFYGRNGIEAITGKSNFDISEWMLLRYLDWLQG